jgi:hypothetical protein
LKSIFFGIDKDNSKIEIAECNEYMGTINVAISFTGIMNEMDIKRGFNIYVTGLFHYIKG